MTEKIMRELAGEYQDVLWSLSGGNQEENYYYFMSHIEGNVVSDNSFIITFLHFLPKTIKKARTIDSSSPQSVGTHIISRNELSFYFTIIKDNLIINNKTFNLEFFYHKTSLQNIINFFWSGRSFPYKVTVRSFPKYVIGRPFPKNIKLALQFVTSLYYFMSDLLIDFYNTLSSVYSHEYYKLLYVLQKNLPKTYFYLKFLDIIYWIIQDDELHEEQWCDNKTNVYCDILHLKQFLYENIGSKIWRHKLFEPHKKRTTYFNNTVRTHKFITFDLDELIYETLWHKLLKLDGFFERFLELLDDNIHSKTRKQKIIQEVREVIASFNNPTLTLFHKTFSLPKNFNLKKIKKDLVLRTKTGLNLPPHRYYSEKRSIHIYSDYKSLYTPFVYILTTLPQELFKDDDSYYTLSPEEFTQLLSFHHPEKMVVEFVQNDNVIGRYFFDEVLFMYHLAHSFDLQKVLMSPTHPLYFITSVGTIAVRNFNPSHIPEQPDKFDYHELFQPIQSDSPLSITRSYYSLKYSSLDPLPVLLGNFSLSTTNLSYENICSSLAPDNQTLHNLCSHLRKLLRVVKPK
ncbi:hypothetical protein ES705_16208 [subsurface metagenome]